MEKWICNVCGYTHEGETTPPRCPQCGAPASKFYKKKKQGFWNLLAILCIVLLIVVFCFTFFSCRSSVTVDNTPVAAVDLNRYLGKWYEVARFDHKFERDMIQCTVHYALQKDGSIKVTNQGQKDGKWKVSEGKAKLTDEPGLLRVSFFGPFYSDYRILMLASDYSYALVGGDSDNYLWILSRTPKIGHDKRAKIVNEANKRGYKTGNLIWVAQIDR